MESKKIYGYRIYVSKNLQENFNCHFVREPVFFYKTDLFNSAKQATGNL